MKLLLNQFCFFGSQLSIALKILLTSCFALKSLDDELFLSPGKEAVAIEAYSRALLQLPTTISDNGGYDSAYLITALRAAHKSGRNTSGLDMEKGKYSNSAFYPVLFTIMVDFFYPIGGSQDTFNAFREKITF